MAGLASLAISEQGQNSGRPTETRLGLLRFAERNVRCRPNCRHRAPRRRIQEKTASSARADRNRAIMAPAERGQRSATPRPSWIARHTCSPITAEEPLAQQFSPAHLGNGSRPGQTALAAATKSQHLVPAPPPSHRRVPSAREQNRSDAATAERPISRRLELDHAPRSRSTERNRRGNWRRSAIWTPRPAQFAIDQSTSTTQIDAGLLEARRKCCCQACADGRRRSRARWANPWPQARRAHLLRQVGRRTATGTVSCSFLRPMAAQKDRIRIRRAAYAVPCPAVGSPGRPVRKAQCGAMRRALTLAATSTSSMRVNHVVEVVRRQ